MPDMGMVKFGAGENNYCSACGAGNDVGCTCACDANQRSLDRVIGRKSHDPAPGRRDLPRWQDYRTPDGDINNCALANGVAMSECQLCTHCPDYDRLDAQGRVFPEGPMHEVDPGKQVVLPESVLRELDVLDDLVAKKHPNGAIVATVLAPVDDEQRVAISISRLDAGKRRRKKAVGKSVGEALAEVKRLVAEEGWDE